MHPYRKFTEAAQTDVTWDDAGYQHEGSQSVKRQHNRDVLPSAMRMVHPIWGR
jgi:hypothetical protein